MFEEGKWRRKEKVLGFCAKMTKSEASKKLRDEVIPGYRLKGEVTPPVPVKVDPTTYTVAAAAAKYVKLSMPRWSKAMRSTIASIAAVHIAAGLGKGKDQRGQEYDKSVAEIIPSDITAWLNAVAEKGSHSLVKKCLTHVRGVFDVCVDDGIVTKNPARAKTVKKPKTRAVDTTFLSIEEIMRLQHAAIRESFRDHLILQILLTCALRGSELFALRVEDVQKNQLFIDEAAIMGEIKHETKTDASKAPVPIPASLRNQLLGYIESEHIADQPRALLFPSEIGTPMSRDNYLDRKLKKLGKAANVRVSFQILRRTVGTHLQKHGTPKDTQALMRHEDPSFTMRVYQQQINSSTAAAVDSWAKEIAFTGLTKQ